MSNIPKMATIKETARITGLSEYYIRRLCNARKIIAVKSGNKWLINVDRFVEYLNSPPGKEPAVTEVHGTNK